MTASAGRAVVRRAQAYIAQRIVTMATNAGCSDSRVIAGFVTVSAWQRAVQPNHVTANPGVVEACGCERPLSVALATARRQRIVVYIILAMTIDAHVTSALQRTIIAMAAFTGNIVVSTRQREIADIMQWLDVGKGLGIVALLALGAVLAFVNIWLGMTTGAIRWARLKGL